MSEKVPVNNIEEQTIGTVSFADEVVAVIAGVAVTEVPGVKGLSGNLQSGVNEMLGRRTPAKGVHVEIEDRDVTVDTSVVLKSGYKIPEVGKAIQDNVKKAVETMTGLNVKTVNVHVSSVDFSEN